MKKIFFLITSCMLSFHLNAQDIQYPPGNQYCAKLQDGKMIVTTDGIELTSDILLENGIKIRTDGTVIKSNGAKIVLEDGECIDKDGKMIEPKFD